MPRWHGCRLPRLFRRREVDQRGYGGGPVPLRRQRRRGGQATRSAAAAGRGGSARHAAHASRSAALAVERDGSARTAARRRNASPDFTAASSKSSAPGVRTGRDGREGGGGNLGVGIPDERDRDFTGDARIDRRQCLQRGDAHVRSGIGLREPRERPRRFDVAAGASAPAAKYRTQASSSSSAPMSARVATSPATCRSAWAAAARLREPLAAKRLDEQRHCAGIVDDGKLFDGGAPHIVVIVSRQRRRPGDTPRIRSTPATRTAQPRTRIRVLEPGPDTARGRVGPDRIDGRDRRLSPDEWPVRGRRGARAGQELRPHRRDRRATRRRRP